jgi:membrane-bound lytic murein transglycosylase D
VKQTAVLLIALLSSLVSFHSSAADSPFVRPKEIEADVRFWVRVYTEITTEQGFIHDDLYLGIVYGTVKLPPNIDRKARNRIVKQVKDRYKDILLRLSRGDHKNLDEEERRVLALWPEDIKPQELREAARRLRFQLGQADNFKAGLIRSGRWMPYILETLRKMDLPREIAVLPHVESSFNPAAYSFVGAAGMWQFTRSTGKRFMRIDHVVDERLDPFIASEAAARLLQHNYSTTNSWPLAITAYNHGLSGMRRAIEQTGDTDVVKVLRTYQSRSFKFASRNFYVAFLAAIDVHDNAERYFGPLKLNPPEQYITLEMPQYMSARVLARAMDIDENIMKRLNPALRPAVWSGDKHVPRGYRLRVPGAGIDIGSLLASIPESERYGKQRPDMRYTVRRGDSLSGIADRFRVRMSDLVAINNLGNRHFIREGQTLRLPQKADSAAGVGSVAAATEMTADQGGVYTVKRGDILSQIAGNFGISEPQLMALNSLENRHRIFVGQRLRISESAEVVAEVASAQPPLETVVAEQKPVEDTPSRELIVAELKAIAEDKLETSEPASEAEAQEISPVQPPGLHPAMAADPHDYSVRDDNTIEILAAETLGHYADWLGLLSQDLRILNRMKSNQVVVIGKRLKLDISRIDRETFEQRRTAYHRSLQEAYFSQYQIEGDEEYTIRRGDSIWELTQQRYRIPLWLLLQYNPDLDLNRLRPGTKIRIPKVSLKDVV